MSRTRLIRPTFFKDAELYDAELASGLPLRVAYIGLWTVTDREGRFPWKPRELKPDVMPHDPLDFSAVLDALEAHGFIQRYVVDGKVFGLIPSFGEHQTFHKSEPPSKLPAPVAPPLPPRALTVRPREDSVAVAVTDTDADTGTDGGAPPVRPWQPIQEKRVAEQLVSDAARTALAGMLARCGAKAGIVGEIEACVGGMRGAQHKATWEQMDIAVCDYAGKYLEPKGWDAPLFRGCVRRAMKPTTADIGPASVVPDLEASTEFEKVRDIVSVGDLRNLDATKITALPDRTKTALKAIGGHMAIKRCAHDKLVWLKKDFIAAYAAAGESAA